jgi:hypothetical protein
MTSLPRVVAAVFASTLIVPALLAQAIEEKPKARVEFRWLEDRAIKNLTEDKGFQTTCGPELSYAHKKPVLTNIDVAEATMKNHGAVMGLPGDHYEIRFRLTDQAKKKLVAESGTAAHRELAIFADGKYWGTAIFRKADAANFEPFAGFINSKAEAERIVAACRTR